MPTPNAFAYLMLLIWPVVSVVLWRRLDPARALIWTLLGGYLIMPMLTWISLPVVPDLDKVTIPNLMALIGSRFVRGDRFPLLPVGFFGRSLVVLFILSPIGTVLTNGDPAFQPGIMLSGIPPTDAVAMVIGKAIELLPFLLARHYLGSGTGNQAVVQALVLGGLIYSVPILIEVVMSPQLHRWIYGFHQHDFFQTMRQGGYRPMVFLEHGLWVAFFILMAMVSSLVLFTASQANQRPKALATWIYLVIILVLCKSAGVLAYACVAVPLVLFTSWRTQILAAASLAIMVTFYPILRGMHLVPVDWILEIAARFSEERAGSLGFRFENEELLLLHAQERGFFGWGGYDRGFLHDPLTGELSTIADGGWIIALGKLGWAGYIAFFALSSLPLLALGRQALRANVAVFNRYTAGLALVLALNLVDLLPNATHIPFTWLITGALLGQAERLARGQADTMMSAQAQVRKQPKRTVI